jgi:hypothetical protein
MDASRVRADALALGRQLVQELELDEGVDTLGKWMAHHLAELIVRAERGDRPAERAAAEDRAVETIQRIWEHRSGSDRLNPLADLEPVLAVLKTLGEEPSPWSYRGTSAAGRAAVATYDLLRRLTICLTLIEAGGLGTVSRGLARARRTSEWQSADELDVAERLETWLRIRPAPHSERASPRRGRKSQDGEQPELDLLHAAEEILGQLEAELPKIREALSVKKPPAGGCC